MMTMKRWFALVLCFFVLPACQTKKEWAACLQETRFQYFSFVSWKKGPPLSITFGKQAAASCYGPGFPVMRAEQEGADNWIQIVQANVAQSTSYQDPSWNLNQATKPWVFLDLSDEQRKNRIPFYLVGQSNTFFDNPQWGWRIGQTRHWLAHLYAVQIHKNSIKPIAGVSWGFRRGPFSWRFQAILPQPLSQEAWQVDRDLLKELFKTWSVDWTF